MSKTRVAVIGAGGIAGAHLRAYAAQAERCQVEECLPHPPAPSPKHQGGGDATIGVVAQVRFKSIHRQCQRIG